MSSESRTREYYGPDAAQVVLAVQRALGLASLELLSPGELVRALRRNKVPFLSMAGDSGHGGPVAGGNGSRPAPSAAPAMLASLEFAAGLAEDEAGFSGPHAEYVELAEAWSRAGIPCICFKSAGIAPSFPYTSDNIDILVQPHHIEEARGVLLGLNYIELRNAEEPDKWLFRRFRAGRSVSAIHLHARVGWDEGFMLEPELWKRARPSDDDANTWVPGPEDAVLINLAHGLIENKEVSLHDVLKVRHALCSGPIDWAYMDRVANERGWLVCSHFGLLLVAHLEDQLFNASSIPRVERERFARTVREKEWLATYWDELAKRPPEMPFTISFWTSKRLFFTKVWRDRHLKPWEKGPSTVLSLARGFKQKSGIRPQSAMLFALSGADGSGKSAQSAALTEAFTTCAIRSQRIWTRVGSTPVLYALHRVRHRLHQGRVAGSESRSAEQQPVSGYGSYRRSGYRMWLWLGAVMLDYMARMQFVRWSLLRGRVVFADRYLCDAEVELTMRLIDRPGLAATLVRMLSAVAPHPDREYLIRVDPDLSTRRDPPLPGEPNRVDECRIYDQIVARGGMCVVDGNRGLEEVGSELVHDALTLYMGRFRPLGNIPFFENDWQLNPDGPWWQWLLSRLVSTDGTKDLSGR